LSGFSGNARVTKCPTDGFGCAHYCADEEDYVHDRCDSNAAAASARVKTTGARAVRDGMHVAE
jgi:hypothetical protein